MQVSLNGNNFIIKEFTGSILCDKNEIGYYGLNNKNFLFILKVKHFLTVCNNCYFVNWKLNKTALKIDTQTVSSVT